jgi:hypothetical protein
MRGSIRMTPAASRTKVGKWAIMGFVLNQTKSDEGRYAVGERAAPAFLSQCSVLSRQTSARHRRDLIDGHVGQDVGPAGLTLAEPSVCCEDNRLLGA